MSVAWDPFDPVFKANPYPTYRALVEEEPLYHSPFGPLLVSRYEDCLTLLRDPAVSSDATKLPGWEPPPGVSPETLISSFLNLDPPDHTHVRGLVSRAFTPQRVERLRPRMQQIVDEALDRAAERSGMEVVGELAFPLPVLIICELLGVPTEDVEQFKVWSANAVRGLDPPFTLSPEVLERHFAAYDQLRAYFHELIAMRRRDPRDDLLTALLRAEEHDDRLNEPELVINLIMLLIAGHETTVNLVANATLAFARHPAQFDRLRQDPALIRSAVEEVLRFDPPLHLRYRPPLKDIELSAGTVPAFAELFLVVAAANRDRRQFDDPQSFDIARPNNRHLSFGFGIHHCVGAPLARLEGEVALGTLARRFSRIELVRDPPRYKENVALPGVAALEVELAR